MTINFHDVINSSPVQKIKYMIFYSNDSSKGCEYVYKCSNPLVDMVFKSLITLCTDEKVILFYPHDHSYYITVNSQYLSLLISCTQVLKLSLSKKQSW